MQAVSVFDFQSAITGKASHHLFLGTPAQKRAGDNGLNVLYLQSSGFSRYESGYHSLTFEVQWNQTQIEPYPNGSPYM